MLVAGHYEGVDRRFEDHVDEMMSIGDYILTGGELPAMVAVDSIARLLKGALREGATDDESHENGLLEYPQYTKPVDWRGEKVPAVLLSGNHGEVEKWRRREALLEELLSFSISPLLHGFLKEAQLEPSLPSNLQAWYIGDIPKVRFHGFHHLWPLPSMLPSIAWRWSPQQPWQEAHLL